jgi:hypothetical protein
MYCTGPLALAELTLIPSAPADDPSAPDSEWSFDNEYVFVFEFNEDGSRVSRVIEMLDSQAVKGVQEILGKAVANLQRKQEKEKGA